MEKSLSEQLDELHAKGRVKTEKMPDLLELIESRNEERTDADFQREKREFHKMQEIFNITQQGKDIFHGNSD